VLSAYLTSNDYDCLERSILDIYDLALSSNGIPARIFEILARHIDADHWGYSNFDRETNSVNSLMTNPPSADEVCQKFRELKSEYPLYVYDKRRHSRPVLFTDFWTSRALQKTALYNDVFRRCGIEYGLLNYDCDGNSIVGIAAFRSGRKNFSEQERARLDVLRPHLRSLHEVVRVLSLSNREAPRPEELRSLGLTMREAEILHHVATGQSNAAIAKLTGCRLKTVKVHLYSIFQKLGVENRSSAMLCAMNVKPEQAKGE